MLVYVANLKDLKSGMNKIESKTVIFKTLAKKQIMEIHENRNMQYIFSNRFLFENKIKKLMADKESSWQGTILSLYGQRSWLRKSLKICQKIEICEFH